MDDEFKRTVTKMKPYAKLLPPKSDNRIRVTLWIRKLVAVSVEKSERNEYAKLLLHMLKSGKLELPFLAEPPIGTLPALTSFKPVMSGLDFNSTLPKPSVSTQAPSGNSLTESYARQPSGVVDVFSKSHVTISDELLRPSEFGNDKTHSENLAERHLEVVDKRTHGKSRRKLSSTSKSKSARNSNSYSQPTSVCTTKNDTQLYASEPVYLIQTNIPYGVETSPSYGGTTSLGRAKEQKSSPQASDRFYNQNKDSFSDQRAVFPSPLQLSLPKPMAHRSGGSDGHPLRLPSTQPQQSVSKCNPAHRHSLESSTHHQPMKGSLTEPRNDPLKDVHSSDSSFSFSDNLLDSEENGGLSDVSELLTSKSGSYDYGTNLKSFQSPQIGSLLGVQTTPTTNLSFTGVLSQPISEYPWKLGSDQEMLKIREAELKVKATQVKFDEEKLNVQRDHEDLMRQVLDHKNNEIENVRIEASIKQTQMEAQLKRLETQLDHLAKENRLFREAGGQTVMDYREHTQKLEAQFDEKLHTVVEEFEANKLDLDQRYGKHKQKLLEETSAHIISLKESHKSQRKIDVAVISKLKRKLKELSKENKSWTQSHSDVLQSKKENERICSSLRIELETAQKRLLHNEGQLSLISKEKDRQLNDMKSQAEQVIQSIQHESSLTEAKVSNVLAEAKQEVVEKERELKEVKMAHRQIAAEQEFKFKIVLRQKDLELENKMSELKKKSREMELKSREKLSRLKVMVEDREQQVATLQLSLETQNKQAERAIDDFKTEVEQQSSSMFEQMRGQVSCLEQELLACRAQTKKESEEFSVLMQNERKREEREKEAMQLGHRQALSELRNTHRSEIDTLQQNLDMKGEEVVAKLTSNLSELEAASRAKTIHSKKVISGLEDQVRELEERLKGLAIEHSRDLESKERHVYKEKDTAVRIHEAAISKLRTQLENQKARLHEDHRREEAALIQRHNHQLQQLKQEHTLKSSQFNETIISLKAQVQLLEENLDKQQCSHEQQINELVKRNELDSIRLQQYQESMRQNLQQEVDAGNAKISLLLERIKHLQTEHDSKLSQLRLHYEEKLKGMLHVSVKQEYEDTIDSLRAQIVILRQRAQVLQEEVQRRYTDQRSR